MEVHMKLTIPGILITALIVAPPTAFAEGGMNFSGTSWNSAKWRAGNPWGGGGGDWGGSDASCDRGLRAGDCGQSWLLQSAPVPCSQPPRTQALAAGLADGFKDHCKI